MCGRYTLKVAVVDELIHHIIHMCNNRPECDCKFSMRENGDVLPRDSAPVLLVANHCISSAFMSWGFDSPNGNLVINARSEDVRQRLMFSGLLGNQRCIIPAAGYYEWRDKDKLKHLITPEHAQPLFFAGLYRSDSKGQFHFVILTRSAFGQHAGIHSRMPCVLSTRKEIRAWLSGEMTPEALASHEPAGLNIEVQGDEQLSMFLDD